MQLPKCHHGIRTVDIAAEVEHALAETIDDGLALAGNTLRPQYRTSDHGLLILLLTGHLNSLQSAEQAAIYNHAPLIVFQHVSRHMAADKVPCTM